MSVTYLSLHLCASWVRARSSTARKEADSSSIRIKTSTDEEATSTKQSHSLQKHHISLFIISCSSHSLIQTFIPITYMHVLTGTMDVMNI